MVAGFNRRLFNLVDYFIPSEYTKEVGDYRSSRIRITIFLIAGSMFVLYLYNALQFANYQLYLNILAITLSGVALMLHKRGVNPHVVANVFMTGAGGAIIGNSFLSGALSSTAALLLIPATCMLISNRITAVIWTLVCFVYLSVIYYLSVKGVEFKVYFSTQQLTYMQYTNTIGMLIAIFSVIMVFERERRKALEELQAEKQKTEELILNILPVEIAEELKQKGSAEAKQYKHVTVLFTDFVGFTQVSELLSPEELVGAIHTCFTEIDAITERHGLEKIKTIGDAYLAVCGLPEEKPDHAIRVIRAAIDIREYMNAQSEVFRIRIGVHTGSVVAGIVGVKKYAYDIWGDTVNMAARMEQHSETGKINISEDTWRLINHQFNCIARGKIAAKNKGEVEMYFVVNELI